MLYLPPPVAEDLGLCRALKRIYDHLLSKVTAFSYFVQIPSDFQEKVSAGCFDHIHSCAFPFLRVRFALMGAVCLDHIHFRALLNKADTCKRLLWDVPKILRENSKRFEFMCF